MEELKQITQIRGAFDQRITDDGKNYGIGGMEIRFVLVGSKGAVQFVALLPVYLDHVRRELLQDVNEFSFKAIGSDIGYHAFTPQYEGQSSLGPCEYLGGKDCYYDGTSLGADKFLPEFISGGSEAVWKMLEETYKSRFEEEL